jgi:hypothetical protein
MAIGREAAAGHDAVKVGMVEQVLTPGVEDGEESDARTQMLRIGGDGEQGL